MSAFVKRLADARASSAIRKIAAVCATGDQYRDYINEAIELLMNRGGWHGTELLMRLCGTGCQVVFPRYVGTVLGVRPAAIKTSKSETTGGPFSVRELFQVVGAVTSAGVGGAAIAEVDTATVTPLKPEDAPTR